MMLPIDYEILRLVWWLLLGVLLIGLAIMDGFDFGVATLLPIVARSDMEKRIVINTVGPVWEGNQVWLILGGGAVFAAWPAIYAVSFSGFYLAMFVILSALIIRPVGFKFRSKAENTQWRKAWDICLFLGGFIPALLFGVAVGNVMQGVPFNFDQDLRVTYTGSFFGLLNPFALLCGLISLCMFVRHGAVYLGIKTEGLIQERLKNVTRVTTVLLILFLSIACWVSMNYLPFYKITSTINPAGPSNPLLKSVSVVQGGYFSNFKMYPWMLLAPVLAFSGLVLSQIFFCIKRSGISFLFSGISIFGIVSIPGVAMFPFLLPSSSHPGHGLTVWDASSSHLTLFIMSIAAVVFVPIVLSYTAWVYKVLKGKVTAEQIKSDHQSY